MTSSAGMVGVNEVENLASQLASQVSYSNELLMQVCNGILGLMRTSFVWLKLRICEGCWIDRICVV